MKREQIGPFVKGINQLADETALPDDQCRNSQNVDFDKHGHYSRREGFTRVAAATRVHSLYSSDDSRILLACQKNSLGYFLLPDLNFYPMITMPQAYKTDWTEHADRLYASNPAFHCRLNPSTFDVSSLAVPLPDPPEFAPMASGGLREGTYTIAWSVTDSSGEESPLSDDLQIEAPEGGGIAITGVTISPGSNLRVYVSQPNGEELYRAMDAPMIATSFTIGINEVNTGGNQPGTRHLEELPFGHFIESHGARLLVAFDEYVGFSEPFRPHLWDPRYNFIKCNSIVTMLASVDDGIFVSDGKTVGFLAGEDPSQFEVKEVDADPAIYGSAQIVPGAHFGGDFRQFDKVVVWLSKTGHHAGLPNGSVVRLNPGQLALPSYGSACSAFSIKDGVKRVLIPVNSNRHTGSGIAVDSEVY